MKKLDLSNIQSGTRKLGAVKATLEHLQEAFTEAIASMFTAFVAGASTPVSIHGCVNSGVGSDYNISAGAIYHDGELFEIDAFVGTAGGGEVPVLSLVTTWRSGDPVKYSDGSTHNTHSIRKYQWSFGTSGSGIADFSTVVTFKSRINDEFLDVDGQITTAVAAAVAALVDSSPSTLDTLNELAAALADDPNFATTITNALAGKVSKSGDVITGTLEVQGGIKTDTGSYLKKKVVQIGDWNMSTTGSVAVLHGVGDSQKIRSVSAMIRNDDASLLIPITGISIGGTIQGGIVSVTATEINLYREATPGVFDSANYDSTSYNRGWIFIEYEA